MHGKRILKSVVFSAGVLTLTSIAPACKTSAGSYCTKVCDCEGCSEGERADCVDTVDDVKKEAENKECASEFDAYFELSCSRRALGLGAAPLDP